MRLRLFSRRLPDAAASAVLRLDWVEVLQTAGCGLCLLAQQKSQRYVATCLDEAVTDVAQRDAWRAAQGFCCWHAGMARATPQCAGSLAILYADLLQHHTNRLAAWRARGWPVWRWLKHRCQVWLPGWRAVPTGPLCPACQLWQAQEQIYLYILLEAWPEADLQHAFRDSQGLCWPHTQQLIGVGQAHRHLAAVLEAQRLHYQRLQKELQAFIRKLDYRFAHEPYGPEADAWQRVMQVYRGPLGPQKPPGNIPPLER